MPPGSLGWCSTKRDINGIHVNGPAGNPWVCTNSICHRLFAIIFKTTTFEITKNLIFVQVFIAFHEFLDSAHLFLFSKFCLIPYTSLFSSALSYISHRNMLDFATTLAPAPEHRYCGSQIVPKFVRLKIQNHQMFRMFFFNTKMMYISDFEVIAHHFLCVVSCVHLI